MAKFEKFKVYLAGPINGCNEAQRHQWRDDVKAKYAKDFSFIDPTRRWRDDALGEHATPLEIVEADLRGIEEAEGMLVNMWRESIGASIGIVHAHRIGRPVVVADPNHLSSQVLAFYADGLEESPLKAAGALRSLLRAERWRVVKSGSRESEPFNRRKLVASIGAACGQARRNDVIVPRIVLPRVIERLKHRKIQDQVTTDAIDKAVRGTLEELGQDEVHQRSVEGVLDVWRSGKNTATGIGGGGLSTHAMREGENRNVSVPISSSKAHSTIWGRKVSSLSDIPSPHARRAFEAIMCVPGITAIHLGAFSGKQRRQSVAASVTESQAPYVLEGKLFDRGEKGTMQTFQVRVQDDARKPNILAQCKANLKSAGLWA